MSERATLIAIRFLGACALVLCTAIAYACAMGNPLDVSASTLAGTVLGGLAGMLTSNHKSPADDPPATPPAP